MRVETQMIKRSAFSKAAIAIGLFLCLLAAPGFAQSKSITLIPNATHKVQIDESVRSVFVSNPKVLDAKVAADGRTILLSALSIGNSEIRIELSKGEDLIYNVQVDADLDESFEQIQKLLDPVEGVEIRRLGNRIVIDGTVLTESSLTRVLSIEQVYGGVVLNLVRMDNTELNSFIGDAIRRDIGLDGISVRVAGETVTLEGKVYDKKSMDRALELAKMRVDNVVNLLYIDEVMVETDIHFLQVKKSKSSDYGMNVLKEASFSLTGNEAGGTDFDAFGTWDINGTATIRINWLLGNGFATVMAKPSLSTKSGQKGTFHSGGESYFAVSGDTGGDLKKVEYGVILEVTPNLMGEDMVESEVSIEVSVPVASGLGEISLDKFKTTSTAVTKIGESVVISGLLQALENRFKERTPFLGHIPLLNIFFSERRKSVEETELVVVLTPRPVFKRAAKESPFNEDRIKMLSEL